MKWRRLTLRVDARDVEAASGLLSTFGNVAVDDENFGAAALDARPQRSKVSIYVPTSQARRASRALSAALLRARRDGLLRSARRSSGEVRDEDWATSWKRYYTPSRLADGLYVVPSWRKDYRAPRGARTIELDPGMAFGTGQHPTTKLALQCMLPHIREGDVVLDIGCGSGILGVAAAQRGARVHASDTDPIAIAATRANFRSNGVRPVSITRAAGVPPAFPRASLIVANITADVLAPLAGAFARRLRRGGLLVTSGVTKRGRSGLLDALARAGLRPVAQRASGEWLAHVHSKEA